MKKNDSKWDLLLKAKHVDWDFEAIAYERHLAVVSCTTCFRFRETRSSRLNPTENQNKMWEKGINTRTLLDKSRRWCRAVHSEVFSSAHVSPRRLLPKRECVQRPGYSIKIHFNRSDCSNLSSEGKKKNMWNNNKLSSVFHFLLSLVFTSRKAGAIINKLFDR